MAERVSFHTVAMLSALLNPKLELQWPESGLNEQKENAGCQFASQILSSHLSKPMAQGSNNGTKMGELQMVKILNTEVHKHWDSTVRGWWAHPQILHNYKKQRFMKLFSLPPGPTLFIHSLYFPYIHIQVEYQGCGNCQEL
jgi:hypothetical protein